MNRNKFLSFKGNFKGNFSQPFFINFLRLVCFNGLCFTSLTLLIYFFFKAPVHSPTNITAFNKSSTSVLVSWVTIPAQQGIGQVMGYTIIFFAVKDGNRTAQNVSVETGHLNETILDNLQIFTNYSIQVRGFTEKDKLGPPSHPIYAMTDEDGKSKKSYF